MFSSTFTGESGKQEKFQPRPINRSIYKPLCLIVVMDIITFKFYYSAPFFPLVSMVACSSRIILQLCAVSRALSWLLPWEEQAAFGKGEQFSAWEVLPSACAEQSLQFLLTGNRERHRSVMKNPFNS